MPYRWLTSAGYPPAAAAAALAASSGDRDAALLRLYAAWTGALLLPAVLWRFDALT